MTKEKLIELFDKKFPPREVDGSNYAYSLMSNEEVKSFLLESINEILDSVEPKVRTLGDTSEPYLWLIDYTNNTSLTPSNMDKPMINGYNTSIADLKDNRKKLGY